MDAPYKPDNIKFKMNNKEHNIPVWKNEKEFFDFQVFLKFKSLIIVYIYISDVL